MLAKLIITPVLYEVLQDDQLIPIQSNIQPFTVTIVADSYESMVEKINDMEDKICQQSSMQ